MKQEAKSFSEQQRQQAKARNRAADAKKEENIEHLERDHRVPRWQALGWHVKESNIEWRWPFSLDWSWVERGERVLHDERFVGLTLPSDFVPPSARIMEMCERQRARATRPGRPTTARAASSNEGPKILQRRSGFVNVVSRGNLSARGSSSEATVTDQQVVRV